MANAADKVKVDESAKAAKRQRDEELSDFRNIMQTPEGRRYVWRMLSVTGVFRTSFTGNSTTFFNEGQRNVGLIIINDLNEACPERYMQMMNEANRKEQSDAS